MGYSISTRNLASIHSFETAQTHWNSQKPWREEHASWRQLDNRRATHKRMVKLSDDRGYQCVLYQTPVVTYFANGNVELRCYDSASTTTFAWCVKPRGCQPTSKSGRMYWVVKTDDGDRYYREASEPLHLQPTAAGNWKLISKPALDHEPGYDRKKGAEVQKALKNYRIWHDTTTRMGRRAPNQHYFDVSDQKAIVRTLLDAPDNIEIYPLVAENAGSPTIVRETAYMLTGARYKSPVPHDRLPRSYA
jgi:hypothetical protein